MAVFYRKYRPQIFAEVLNQKPIIRTLQHQVAAGSVAHAYLFTGSRGVGKTSVARILAKAVNCLNHKPSLSASGEHLPPKGENNNVQASPDALGEACGECDNCKAIEAGNFMDMVEIDAASNTGVDNIRDLIEHVKFSPSSGKYKVFIIDEVHMLSKGAFNALLKTLEEPPRHALFILATTEINKVPATIVSRTQRFDFKALSVADIFGHLEKISKNENLELSKEILELVAENAEGSVRDALSLLGKVATLGSHASLEDCQQLLGITDIAVCEELLGKITHGEVAGLPDFFGSLSERGLDYAILARDFLEYLRKVLIYKSTDGKINFALREQRLSTIAELAALVSMSELIFIIRLFLKAYKDLQSSPSPQIPLLLASIEAALRKSEGRKVGESENRKVGAKENQKDKNIEEVKKNEASVSEPIISQQTYQTQAVPDATDQPKSYEDISLPEVRIFFPKVIAKIKAVNSPLSSLIRNSELLNAENGKIFLGVKFLFNKQNLESPKNAGLINSTIEEVSGKKLTICVQVIKAEIEGKIDSAQVLTQALQVFGGELIE